MSHDPGVPDDMEPDDPEVRAFWDLARFHAKLNAAPSYFGPTTLEVVVPPAWSHGATPDEADEFASSVLAGSTTSTSASQAEYDEAQAPLPEAGTMSILCDGAGKPVALLETRSVDVAGGMVTETFAVVYASDD